mmetsp:Transcript_21309/g.48075  ORF Transcript_21309/g.48075 Transcript_21309/m.48075 type:complete len:379 (+) Transcript_21309:121-1257(+)
MQRFLCRLNRGGARLGRRGRPGRHGRLQTAQLVGAHARGEAPGGRAVGAVARRGKAEWGRARPGGARAAARPGLQSRTGKREPDPLARQREEVQDQARCGVHPRVERVAAGEHGGGDPARPPRGGKPLRVPPLGPRRRHGPLDPNPGRGEPARGPRLTGPLVRGCIRRRPHRHAARGARGPRRRVHRRRPLRVCGGASPGPFEGAPGSLRRDLARLRPLLTRVYPNRFDLRVGSDPGTHERGLEGGRDAADPSAPRRAEEPAGHERGAQASIHPYLPHPRPFDLFRCDLGGGLPRLVAHPVPHHVHRLPGGQNRRLEDGFRPEGVWRGGGGALPEGALPGGPKRPRPPPRYRLPRPVAGLCPPDFGRGCPVRQGPRRP